jgi:hypothetical protein
MEKMWKFLMAMLVGASVIFGPTTLSLWARPNPPFHGDDHGRGRGHDKEDRGRGHREHRDNGRHRGWYKDREGRYRFDDYDRRAVVRYYDEHRDERWFREPMPRGVRLGYGYVLEPRYRRYCHPLPVVMLRELPPPPPNYRYFLFGGRVVLFDSGYRVQDFISLNFNIGR